MYNCNGKNHFFKSFSAVQIYEKYEEMVDTRGILHHLRVYYYATMRPDPGWLDSLVSRALHSTGIAEVMGSNPIKNFFPAVISELLKLSV